MHRQRSACEGLPQCSQLMPCVLLDSLHMQQVLNMLCMQLMDGDKPLSLLLQDSD